jgi:anti-sigma regulatory factor (Ser/Thr protein kinase)
MSADGFRHEALFYDGESEFLVGTVPFIRQGLEQREAVLVVVSAAKIDLLRRELGEDASLVMFADMAGVGANPARIVPAWRDFVDQHGGTRALRGIGEPIWSARPADELVECQRHESLLNVAFGGGPAWRLLCPYDTSSLPEPVLEEARRSHQYVVERHVELPSPQFRGVAASGAEFSAPLSPVPAKASSMGFARGELVDLRRLVAGVCATAGLDHERTLDLVSAANEVATNSIEHGGGSGTVLVWQDGVSVVCEIRDRGRYAHPLADRERPTGTASSRGLWLANQLCDLVQIRTYPTGTVVRLVVRRHHVPAPTGWSWATN